MAIIAKPIGYGQVEYVDESGNSLSNDEVQQRVQASRDQTGNGYLPTSSTFANTVNSAISGVKDVFSNALSGQNQEAAQQAGWTPEKAQQLYGLYISNSKQTDPDKAARLNEAANILDIPDQAKASMVGQVSDSVLKAAEEAAKAKQNSPDDWQEFAQNNPATADYLAKQKNMSISWDDIPALQKVENTLTSIMDHATLADLEDRRAAIGTALLGAGGDLSDLDAGQRTELEDINNQMATIQKKYGNDPNMKWYNPATWDMANVIGGIASMKNDVATGLEVGGAGAGIGAGLGALAGGVGAIPGALAGAGKGFASGLAFHMSDRAMGNAYLDRLSQKGVNGQEMDSGSAAVGAYMTGIGNAVIGAGGIGRLMSKLPGGPEIFEAFKKVAPEETLANPVAATAAWRTFAQNFIQSTAEQSVIFGGATKALDIAAQRTAEQLSGLTYDHSQEPSTLDQILQATADFVPTAAVMGGAAGTIRLPFDLKKASDFNAKQALTALNDAVTESKTASRAPENIGELVQGVTKDSPIENIQIPANEWVRYWQEKTPEDQDAAVKMAEKAGIKPEDVAEAIATGGDLTLKSSDFVKTFGRTEHFDGLMPDVRLRADDFTQREQENAMQSAADQIKALSDTAEGKAIDKSSELYQEALNTAKAAYPDVKSNSVLEKQANLIYSLAQRADERGVLQALNVPDATTALRNINIRRLEKPSTEPLTEYLQGKNEGPLASYVPTGTAKGIVELYKGSNYSSLAHEMMHHFTELHRQAAESGSLSEDGIRDFKTMQDYAGNKGEAWTREQHEKIASAWEKYLAEGKAPSLELVGAFDKFKTWMTNIYHKLVGQGVEVSEDIRQVFDRMLASDEQIAQAEMFYSSERLMGGKPMGLAALKQYTSTLAKAHEEAQKQLYAKALEDLKPEFQKRLNDFTEKSKVEESNKMRTQEPLYMAREAMEYSEDIPKENPGREFIIDNKGPLKLNLEETERQYGKGSVPKQFMSKDGKFTLDLIADIFGYKSGDELRQEILNNKPFGAELNKRVAARLAEFKQQEIGNLRDEATKAVHNNYNLEAIAIESEAIQKAFADLKNKNNEKLSADWQKAKDQNKQDQKLNDAVQAEKDKGQNKIDAAQEKASQQVEALQSKVDDLKETRRWDMAINRGKLRATAAREAAEQAITNKPIGEAGSWKKYVQQAVKSGKEAADYLNKGDYENAIKSKDQELLNHAMAMAAAKVEKEIDKGMRFFKKFDKRGADMKGVPHEFNRQIDNLLYRYNLIRRDPLQPLDPNNIMNLNDFVKDCEDQYMQVYVADSMRNEADTRPYTRLNLNEFRDLKDSVKSIHHVGRMIDRALADDRKEGMQERIDSISASLGELPQRYAKDFTIGKRDIGLLEKLGRIPDMFNTSLVKMESFCQIIDKGETGYMTKYVLNPIYKALDNYNLRSDKVGEDFNAVIKDAGFTPKEIAKMAKDKKHFDFLANDLTMAEIVQAALNWGNEGNKDRIRRGYFLTEDQKGRKLQDFENQTIDERVMQVFGQLEEKHWKLIQGIWDYLDTYAPEVRQHELDITGIDPKMVDATPFQVLSKDGKTIDLKGGYYPIAYDPLKSTEALKRQEELSALYVTNPATKAMTRHGFTESRVNTLARPIMLDWSVLTNHIRNVNYDLSMRKAVIDVNRLLNNAEVKSLVSSTFGVKTHGEMLNWLRYVASDQSETMRGGEQLFKNVRSNVTKAALGFRVKAMFEDLPINVLQSCWQLGITDTIKGISDFYLSNPIEQKAFVDTKSSMMKERLSFLDRDISDFSKSVFDNKNLSNKASKFIFIMDSMADASVVYPIWQKAYANALKKGLSDTDAIMEADGYVRRTTADGSRAGLVNIQRGTEYSKVMTMFYTWYSGLFNRYWMSTKMAQVEWNDNHKLAATNTMLRAGLYGWVLPGVIGGLVKAGFNNTQTTNPQKKDEQNIKSFASAFLTQPLGTIPVIGNLASFGVNKALGVYDNFSISPIENALEKIVDVGPALINYANAKPGDNNAGQKLAETTAGALAYGAGNPIGIPAYPAKLNTWAFNFLDALNNGGDLTVSDIIARRHKAK